MGPRTTLLQAQILALLHPALPLPAPTLPSPPHCTHSLKLLPQTTQLWVLRGVWCRAAVGVRPRHSPQWQELWEVEQPSPSLLHSHLPSGLLCFTAAVQSKVTRLRDEAAQRTLLCHSASHLSCCHSEWGWGESLLLAQDPQVNQQATLGLVGEIRANLNMGDCPWQSEQSYGWNGFESK